MIPPLKSFAFLLLASASLPAAIVANYHGGATPNQAAYDGLISATDLGNSDQTTLTSLVSSKTPAWNASGLNDGRTNPSAGDNNGLSVYNTPSDLPTTITFTLDISVNTLGYNITGINSIAGWTDANYAGQIFDLYLQTTSSGGFVKYGPTFTNISGLDSSTRGDSYSTMTSLTDSSGIIASGVTAVRLVYTPSGVENSNGTLIREIDVIGAATQPIPEPSATLLLISAGVTIVLVFRKRRQTAA